MTENSFPAPASINANTNHALPMLDLINKMHYIQGSGNRIEHSLRNSIEIKRLIEQESQGIGHMTITEYFDVIQDLYTNGKIQMFDDITLRRKSLNSTKSELERENEAYRHILEHIMREFTKKTSGYQAWAEAIRILLERIDNKQYD